jgi:hypothetical protein
MFQYPTGNGLPDRVDLATKKAPVESQSTGTRVPFCWGRNKWMLPHRMIAVNFRSMAATPTAALRPA